MGRLERLYARLPVAAQHLAVSGYGVYRYWLRRGPGYKAAIAGYRAREHFTEAQWREWQVKQLGRVLGVAATHVPHYRDTWDTTAKHAASVGRLEEIPLLEKEPLRADPSRFERSDIRPRHRVVFHSSGTTGTPIASIWTVPEIRQSIALREARSAQWAGVSFSNPRATFSGRLVVPDSMSQGPFHRFNWIERQVYFSAFHLGPKTARSYVRTLHEHQTEWLTGYAMSFFLLARSILDQQIEVPSTLRAVITTSEKLTPEMRELMQEAYRCRVYEEYSTVETALFASECKSGHLHVSPDAGVVEILRSDGTPAPPGEIGEVVATCLFRSYQPLIRFRLGDLASWEDAPCPCGRAMPIIREVIGRTEDIVIGPDGREMVRFHGIFVDQPRIREGQIIQETLRRIRVKIVPVETFTESDRQCVVERIHERLGPSVEVVVETVEEIPRTSRGKFRAVISQLEKGPG